MRRDPKWQALIRAWEQYVAQLSTVGYSGATTIYRAMMGGLGGEFESRLPNGVEKLNVSDRVVDLIRAMAELENYPDDSIALPVVAMQHFYVMGLPETQQKVATALGKESISPAKIYNLVDTGEILLKREINWR